MKAWESIVVLVCWEMLGLLFLQKSGVCRQCLKKTINSGIDAKLLLIGEGSLKQNVMSLVDELGLGDKVLFLGKREDMPSLFLH
ncbi:hypothetical protein HSBAA_63750 [Vreelandella sulfidaeris]|uniref:Glycosyl transferase family 1 domain-containing protein n=1 Tax=Vreelandella sulfidaeris TaxID=115553 RepID=A0A455ULD4_9GAMM|nr:hypothetical protein HSBAA_63750 [Halomonas sulfidaeris]